MRYCGGHINALFIEPYSYTKKKKNREKTMKINFQRDYYIHFRAVWQYGNTVQQRQTELHYLTHTGRLIVSPLISYLLFSHSSSLSVPLSVITDNWCWTEWQKQRTWTNNVLRLYACSEIHAQGLHVWKSSPDAFCTHMWSDFTAWILKNKGKMATLKARQLMEMLCLLLFNTQ